MKIKKQEHAEPALPQAGAGDELKPQDARLGTEAMKMGITVTKRALSARHGTGKEAAYQIRESRRAAQRSTLPGGWIW